MRMPLRRSRCLVSFIPMLMDTGGNSGSQSSTMIIRGMALGDDRAVGRILKVVWKESTGRLDRGICAGGGELYPPDDPVSGKHDDLRDGGDQPVLPLWSAAKTIGCTLPIGAKVLKLDPAIMASPMITTIVDAVSLMVYFNLACHLLDMAA